MHSRSTVRLSAIAMLSLFVLSMTSCESKNKGIIVGKWKVTSSSKASEVAQLSTMGMAMYFDFKADGNLGIGLMALKPEGNMLASAADTEFQKKVGKVTYSLASGERINFDSTGEVIKGKARTNAAINGDKMTMTDPDGTTLQLERVK